jgi:homoserine kinase
MHHLPLRVRVPASTSNLGPGFDCLGVALTRFVEVELRAPAERHRFVALDGEAVAWPREDELVTRALDLALGGAAARDAGGFEIAVRSDVPVARGLGSSGSAVAAGLLLGDALSGRGRSRAELLALGLELEGHPDNLAPALFGGARLSVPRPDRAPRVIAVDVHPSIGWAVAWPAIQVPTEAARAALPRSVAFAAAVENPRRLALLLRGLADGDAELLAEGTVDRLHVEHRLALVPGSGAVLAAARGAGAWAATLSGSGSAHVALTPRERAADVADAMAAAWRELTGAGTGVAVEIAPDPPEVAGGA